MSSSIQRFILTWALLGSLLSSLVTSTTFAAELSENGYLSDLVRLAAEAKLSEKRFWHLLLHYRPNVWEGFTSEVDDPGFFLSSHGKMDPKAELEATLAKFFSKELVGRSRQPAQCAFIARYHWLKEQLSFDDQRLPPLPCLRFHSWFAELNPQSITLIFPSAFMNNPASMFGHTFLRVDQKGQTKQTRILAYTINYAAEVPPDVGMEFAIKGIFGGYDGYFSTIPYYIKVQEYRDIENRDIWEYRLNMTEEQILRMMMHTWEMDNAYFDYFFFKENCAYHILSLLEVANPDWYLTDQFVFWTVPADTIRLLIREPDLVGEIAYRPSRSTQIRRKRDLLTNEERGWFSRIIRSSSVLRSKEFAQITPERQAFLLDVASDYLRYKKVTDPAKAERYKEQIGTVLRTRSKIKVRSGEVKIAPFAEQPEIGHETSRIGLGVGWREDELFEELSLRAVYHDLLDPDQGYTPDAQIELAGFRFRHYEEREQTRLERATLANVLSLSPMDGLFKTPSWKINAGFQTVHRHACGLCGNWNLNGGIGAALETRLAGRQVYFAFAEIDANHSKAYADDHRVGGGGTAGVLLTLTDRWKLMGAGTYLNFPLGDRSDDIRVFVGQRFTLNKNLAVRLEFNHQDRDNEGVLAIQAFF